MNRYDLVIRGGTVFAGMGGDPFEADVAIENGRVAALGRLTASGREEIDARGRIVTPGFVDIHTHYDGQVTWENRLIPSCYHGVTTAVMGNCGVGFAPCRADDRELLMRLMEGVEEIPNPILADGLPWCWETYPEYLDFLASRSYDVDVASLVPHSALRTYAMGQRGFDREPATGDDLARMAALLREAVKAGALGFGTSRLIYHRSSDGNPVPTLTASENELMSLALALKECNAGLIQIIGDFRDWPKAFSEMRNLTQRSGRPLTFSFGETSFGPVMWPEVSQWLAGAHADGLVVKAQVCPRAVAILLAHDLALNPFCTMATYRALAALDPERRIAELRKPEVRARILSEAPDINPANLVATLARDFERIYPLNDPPNYEPEPASSIAALAAKRGMRADELAYELLLENDGRAMLYAPISNYRFGNLDSALEQMRHEDTVLGLGDGGAHVGSICDASYSTFALTHWARDRTRGERLPLPAIVRSLTSTNADLVGLRDRGRVMPGYKADLNVIDFDRLQIGAPQVTADLPAGGRRLIQRAQGYDATIVSGSVVYRNGEPTGTLPGRLVRGAQGAPGV